MNSSMSARSWSNESVHRVQVWDLDTNKAVAQLTVYAHMVSLSKDGQPPATFRARADWPFSSGPRHK